MEHYLEVRGDRRMPSRRDIDALRLGPALPIIWMSEYEPAAGTFRYRLAGEEVNDIWGFAVAGRLLSDFVPPERFSPTNESFLKVLRDEAALIASGAVYRSEEHTSELQSLMRNSYAVFCLKKKTKAKQSHATPATT